MVDPELARAENKARRFWVSLVVTFLGLQILIGVASIKLATGDSSAAIVPDYHTTALNWDSERLKHSAADRLGISVKIDAANIADGNGMRALTVTLTNQKGEAELGFRVSARIYHHTDANHVEGVNLKSVGDGRYIGLAPMKKAGVWQVETVIDGADEPILESAVVEIRR